MALTRIRGLFSITAKVIDTHQNEKLNRKSLFIPQNSFKLKLMIEKFSQALKIIFLEFQVSSCP